MSAPSKTGTFRFRPILPFLLLFAFSASAQVKNPYDYQALSHFAGMRMKDSLKKKWLVPTLYKEKETQKKFKELWDSRTMFISSAIENKNFIQEKEVYEFLDEIVEQLHDGNSALIPRKPILLIDRSAAVNAYSIGGNIIAVNLGLISYATSREEIALVLAHELSHDILGHSEKSMKERAEYFTSDQYKASMNDILDSRYERYSKLQRVMEGYTFNRTRHNRYHEGEADSLAIVLLKNSRISFKPEYFLRLDSSDGAYRTPLKKPVAEYFTSLNLAYEPAWMVKRSKGLSTKNFNIQQKQAVNADSLKTHPDCVQRFESTKKWATANFTATPIPANIQNKVSKMMIWNIFDNGNMTACLYWIFKQKDAGVTDEWYTFMTYNVIASLCLADNKLARFNAINVQAKEDVSQHYFDIQSILEQMPRESMDKSFKALREGSFWEKVPADARGLKGLFGSLLLKDATDKDVDKAARYFLTTHTKSMYCEFAEHFIIR